MVSATSDSTPTNPYSKLNLYCIKVQIKDHAKLVGIISLAVFISLIIVSYAIFGPLSIAFIVCGVIIYGFLIESLLRKPNKAILLAYVTYEALQITFYASVIILLLIPTTYLKEEDKEKEKEEEKDPTAILVQLIVFLVLLIVVKIYFARVMIHLYKFYSWNERNALMSIQYLNGRGVQITVDNQIFPPPNVWNAEMTSKDEQVECISDVQPVPSYEEAVQTKKATETASTTSNNPAGPQPQQNSNEQ